MYDLYVSVFVTWDLSACLNQTEEEISGSIYKGRQDTGKWVCLGPRGWGGERDGGGNGVCIKT